MISLKPADWRLLYGPGMPKHPAPNGNGWEFDFPIYTRGEDETFRSVNYVTTKKFGRLKVGQTLTVNFIIEASPGVVWEYRKNLDDVNTGPRPANLRFFFQKGLNGRWWSNPVSYDCGPTTRGLLIAPLQAASWSDVRGRMGDQAEKAFRSAVKGADQIGFTFGGGSFFGHGVWISKGSAKFILKDYMAA